MELFTGEEPASEEYTDLDTAPVDGQPLTEAIQNALSDVVKKLENEDKETRNQMLRLYKLCELYWKGIQTVFWSEFRNDWRTPWEESGSGVTAYKFGGHGFDKIVNVYRAHGESIVAALGAAVPSVRFFPRNADSPEDLSTSRTFSNTSEMLQRRNQAELLFIRALFILYNQAFVAAHNYAKQDEQYGIVEDPIYTLEEQEVDSKMCPDCGTDLSEEPVMEEATGMAPEMIGCHVCGSQEPPMITKEMKQVPTLSGYDNIIKSNECIEVYGPLNVRIPVKAKSQAECIYLMLETEEHYAQMREQFPDYWEKINPGGNLDEYDRWARAMAEYDDENISDVTWRRAWLRPAAFNILDKEKAELLKKEFPDGCRVDFVNEQMTEVRDEKLDEHWTITVNPLSRYIHADPMGKPMLPIQEWKNETTHLTVETVRYTIPQTFADSSVLDFKQYAKAEIRPGVVFPVKGRTGQNIDSAFFQTRTATLAKEVIDWESLLEKDGQFVVGDFPSIFGGPQSGSKTLGEYQESRSNALNRLGIVWKMLNSWWAQVMGKSVQDYINHLIEDEQFSQKQGDGYINVWIRLSEISGKVGRIEAETSEQFPMSWAQKRGVLLELLGLNKESVDFAVFHPDNVETVQTILGLDDLHIPGEADRLRELYNIAELLRTEPMMDEMGQGIPSVMIEEDVDDDVVHIQTCKTWALSEQGREAQVNNPGGYANVIAHLKMHVSHQQFLAQQEAMMGMGGEGPLPTEPPADMLEGNAAVEPPMDGEPMAEEPL